MRSCMMGFLLLLLASEARAEIVRCYAAGLSEGSEVRWHVSIALPPEKEHEKVSRSTSQENQGKFVSFVGGISPKRQGWIEISVASPVLPYWAQKG